VRRTQRAIKQALTERYYSWRDAEAIAKDDPEINLSGDGPTYVPRDFLEEEVPEEHEDTAAEIQQEVKAEARPNA
jgi:large subunit ribosomal protein L47